MLLKISLFNILCLSLILISHNGYTQDWLKDTCELNGNVKSVHYTSNSYWGNDRSEWEEDILEYNEQGYLVGRDRSSDWGGKHFNAYYRVYSHNGEQCLKEYYIQDQDTASLTKFFYNDKGQISSSKLYNWGRYWNTCTYTYNEQDLVVNQTNVTASGFTSEKDSKYDEDGRLIFHSYLSNTVKKFTYWTYDNKGLVLEEKYLDSNWASRTTHYMGNDSEPDSSVTEDFSKKAFTGNSYILKYGYNEMGQVISIIKTDVDGNLINKQTFTFNANGDRIKRVYYDAEKEKEWVNSYKYKYDSAGNWTKRTTTTYEEKSQVESRKIKYY
jgi:hypothetical protein